MILQNILSLVAGLLPIAKHETPRLPNKFRMDIDLLNLVIPELPILDRAVSAFGTYFHDNVNHRSAAYLIYSISGTDDLSTFKFVNVEGKSYVIDMATGKCIKTSGTKVSGLPEMAFEQMTWLLREKNYYRVSQWSSTYNVSTPFGIYSTDFSYLHSPVKISPDDPRGCYDIPSIPKSKKSSDSTAPIEIDEKHYGEPMRLTVESRLPYFAYPYEMALTSIFEFSCVIKGFGGVDEQDVFSVPKWVCNDDTR